MDFKPIIRDNHLTGERIVSAQLVNLKSLDILTLADELSEEGSSHTQSDIVGVLLLLKNKLPSLLYKGYKLELGIGTLRPSVSGSVTESAWRAGLTESYIAQGMTETEAKAKANEKEFTSSVLTSAKLTAGITIDVDPNILNKYQNLAHKNWKRVTSGTSEEGSGQTPTPTPPADNTNPDSTGGSGSSSVD